MKKTLCILFGLMIHGILCAQWRPAGDKLKTEWTSSIDVNNVWAEYPRPIMERPKWKNLNGLWQYSITPLDTNSPQKNDGEILVPFAIESSLSGVQRRLTKDELLWYEREFTVPNDWKEGKVLLHFGAVDWQCTVWVNNIKVGMHSGGYSPFSFDITNILVKGNNKIIVKVFDPSNEGYQPAGKQFNQPHGTRYTPVSGIWQTVWLENVPNRYIINIKTVPDIDTKTISIKVETNAVNDTDIYHAVLFDGKNEIASAKAISGEEIEIHLKDFKLWTPDNPNLYDLKISLLNNNKEIDRVNSYTAMRKFSTRRDENGIVRLQLNNKDLFQFGTLDQGWWPDGLYTAPCDEALKYDIIMTKELGYNMIRKHVKVEPARWYTHCDRVGMIVWQDMPNGDKKTEWQNKKMYQGAEYQRSPESEATYRKEWKEIMDFLYSYPSIGVWVPFNEAWGQFKTVEITEWTKMYDPSRLVNSASGGNHFVCGDMLDLHNYPAPAMYLYDASRANVLGEYGGIGLLFKDHSWEPDRNWGYIQFQNSKDATDKYLEYAASLKQLIKNGLSAAIYTQTTDVEIEINGLMTYDRKVVKLDEQLLRKINSEICKILDKESL
ncbi:glycoside hydrolase family 2 protein [Proteiniphilum sp. UBA5384]|jgi:beta-galactosidase/beta-glucuronidase|uniref:glycoside hydrolase family 2 protein n=1 Tax=Proteiniphilum sp. UBA5384 TaxID=1947279 RepID=UPI0025F52EE0|nr:sugar-binding domain-containing protein [Proteiniphilum sp. UBA5384]